MPVESVFTRLEPLLASVQKPIQYVGGELNATLKDWDAALKVARQVVSVAPENMFGHVNAAYALHSIRRTAEAKELLLSVVELFPKEYIICYNLACYCCQLGDLRGANEWLIKSCGKGSQPPPS